MAKSLLKTSTSENAPFRSEFWEIWLLVLVLVTIFGLFAQSQNKIQLPTPGLNNVSTSMICAPKLHAAPAPSKPGSKPPPQRAAQRSTPAASEMFAL